MKLETTGEDPLSHDINLISISLPNSVYIAQTTELGKDIVRDIAGLMEQRGFKKVIYGAKPVLAFARASVDRKLNGCDIFDLMIAEQICWSGYHYLMPSNSTKNPWKRNIPHHSLASLAERHLGITLDGECWAGKEASVLLPLHDILAELLARNCL